MKSDLVTNLKKVNHRLERSSVENYLRLLMLLIEDQNPSDDLKRLHGLLRARAGDAIIEWADSMSAQKYTDATQHFVANQFALLIKKYPWPKNLVKTDPEAAAIKKFWAAEHDCLRTNQRFSCKRSPNEPLLSRARNFIAYVLGMEPDLAEVWGECNFGPGANIGVHGNATNVARKIGATSWSVTPSAVHYVAAAVTTHAQLSEYFAQKNACGIYCRDPGQIFNNVVGHCNYVNHNIIVFVPKTAKVHRTIAIEPLGNGFVQKGVDIVMRKRLAHIGIDLSDQSLNQRMARQGSLDDSDEGFVTIDLSSASDSVSRGVVTNLLPPAWTMLLNGLRSKWGELDGKYFPYNKFCSMGNGFCFPLETLIFTSACVATNCGAPGKDFSVYGDDIIVRKKHAQELLAFLSALGFRVNTEKTFLQGPFRESCGADWFGGEDVRPFTLDFPLDSVGNVFKILNLTKRNARTTAFFSGVRGFLLSLLPDLYHLKRPVIGNADTGIDVETDEFMSCRYARWNKTQFCWRWTELDVQSKGDTACSKHERYHLILVYGALQGVASSKPFTFRRKTETKVRKRTHSAATSQWLPSYGETRSSLKNAP